MEYRKLGQSELYLSAITLGAWAAGGWMWGGTERVDAIEAIRAAYSLGVTSIDTAPIYGQGQSEEIVGEAIKGIPRDKVQILTKFGMRWDDTMGDFGFKSVDNNGKPIDVYKYAGRDSIIKECEDSLRRLQTDYIDLYQIHWPDVTTSIEETFEAVLRLEEQGKIRAAGVSNYNMEQTQQANAVLPIASNQVPYSILRRNIERELVPYAIKNEIGILAYSPLERGLLTGKIKPGHVFPEGDHRAGLPVYSGESVVKVNGFLDKIKPLADSKYATLSQLILRWTIDQPGITIALAGTRNVGQSIVNAGAIDIKLEESDKQFIQEQLVKAGLYA
ncbi:aldo/keto reductase [Russula earlei]|uniref:Aldo/keto reductase n=1 Tax=Russula earlei TaxID=71964 RepID=A0ACC0TSP9_9AGAM|nr:aldo/keto reductase [Russula earlei]